MQSPIVLAGDPTSRQRFYSAAHKAGDHLPQWRLDLTLEQTVDGRTARLEAFGEDWQARLHGI